MSGRTSFADDLVQAMSEALAHAKGKNAAGVRIHHADVPAIDAKSVRKKLRLTQERMAQVLGPAPRATANGNKASAGRAARR